MVGAEGVKYIYVLALSSPSRFSTEIKKVFSGNFIARPTLVFMLERKILTLWCPLDVPVHPRARSRLGTFV